MAFTIDPEFQGLIPPLTAEERAGLEESIAREGVRDPLVVWSEKDILLDGHNRHEIATRLGKPYNTVGMSFADREHARVWIYDNQLGRRNLTDSQRAMTAHLRATEMSGIAKRERATGAVTAREVKAGRAILEATAASKMSGNPKDRSRKAAAKAAGVSERQVRRAAEVAARRPDLIQPIIAGTVTLADDTEKPDLLAVAVAKTEDIIACIDAGLSDRKPNWQDGSWFECVSWWQMVRSGYTTKYWTATVPPEMSGWSQCKLFEPSR